MRLAEGPEERMNHVTAVGVLRVEEMRYEQAYHFCDVCMIITMIRWLSELQSSVRLIYALVELDFVIANPWTNTTSHQVYLSSA